LKKISIKSLLLC